MSIGCSTSGFADVLPITSQNVSAGWSLRSPVKHRRRPLKSTSCSLESMFIHVQLSKANRNATFEERWPWTFGKDPGVLERTHGNAVVLVVTAETRVQGP